MICLGMNLMIKKVNNHDTMIVNRKIKNLNNGFLHIRFIDLRLKS